MRRSYPSDPLLQRVKGVFIFNDEVEEGPQKSLELLKTLKCEVLSSLENRITVSTSRGNLQNIKKSWLSPDPNDNLGKELKQCVSQIIMGGNIYST